MKNLKDKKEQIKLFKKFDKIYSTRDVPLRVLFVMQFWSIFSNKRLIIFLEMVVSGKAISPSYKDTKEIPKNDIDDWLKVYDWETK